MNNIAYEEILKDLTPFQQATILYNDEHISEEDKICMLHQLQRKADESLKKQIEESLKFMRLKLENFENSKDGFVFVVNGVNEALEEIEQKIELIKDELDRKSNEIQNYIATFIAVFGLISIVASVLTIVDLVGGGTNKIQAALEISCIGIAAFVVSWVVMMMKSGNRR